MLGRSKFRKTVTSLKLRLILRLKITALRAEFKYLNPNPHWDFADKGVPATTTFFAGLDCFNPPIVYKIHTYNDVSSKICIYPELQRGTKTPKTVPLSLGFLRCGESALDDHSPGREREAESERWSELWFGGITSWFEIIPNVKWQSSSFHAGQVFISE